MQNFCRCLKKKISSCWQKNLLFIFRPVFTLLIESVGIVMSLRASVSNVSSSMKFSRTNSSVKVWRFSDVSGTNSVPIFRVCWWFGRTTSTPWRLKRSNSRNVGKPFWSGCLSEKFSEFCHHQSFKTYVSAWLPGGGYLWNLMSGTFLISVGNI